LTNLSNTRIARFQEIILVSASFSELEGHCELGYTTDADVLAATHGVKKMAEIFLGSRGAEEGPCRRIVGGGNGGSTQDSKAAYLRQLATDFSILIRDVKNAYLQSKDQGVTKVSPLRALPFRFELRSACLGSRSNQ
jgi:hypothetical protein